ncbi:MAG: polymer-forming cytoskeletal protein [Acidobacteriota bacterium]|nr:polymer-forming cytoskeletal protein [Acidobacteriota bacterium]MDH3524988.1 polymer-forming cytoskeletal protein [Acidobacteriota bacterium]
MAWTRTPDQDPAPAPRAPGGGPRVSTLGSTIAIKGDLTGAEDLRIEGSVEGTIRLDGQSVVVSESGRITADIHGRSICVEGRVKGNLHGEKEIIIRPSGQLEGNITAPSVTLENGAKFRGSIDMEPTPGRREAAGAETGPAGRGSGRQSAAGPDPGGAERRPAGSRPVPPAVATAES